MDFREEYKKSMAVNSPDRESIDRMKAAVLAMIAAGEGEAGIPTAKSKSVTLRRFAYIGGTAAACAVIAVSAATILPNVDQSSKIISEADTESAAEIPATLEEIIAESAAAAAEDFADDDYGSAEAAVDGDEATVDAAYDEDYSVSAETAYDTGAENGITVITSFDDTAENAEESAGSEEFDFEGTEETAAEDGKENPQTGGGQFESGEADEEDWYDGPIIVLSGKGWLTFKGERYTLCDEEPPAGTSVTALNPITNKYYEVVVGDGIIAVYYESELEGVYKK